jgi:predicted ribosomally synthesized peptide with nif11-like leader
MSEEQLKAFLDAVKADAGLQEKLKAAADADAVVAIAKEVGFMISADELLERAQAVGEELSDEELERVTGGTWGLVIVGGAALGFGAAVAGMSLAGLTTGVNRGCMPGT